MTDSAAAAQLFARAAVLRRAAQAGNNTLVRQLLEQGAAADTPQDDGCTALWLASEKGNVEVCQSLLHFGADVNAVKATGNVTPLYIAAQNGHTEVVRLLLSHAARIDEPKSTGATPLFIAAQQNFGSIVFLLLTAGSNVATRNHMGITPLMIAAYQGNADVVEMLLRYGADPYAVGGGRNAFEWASANNKDDVIRPKLLAPQHQKQNAEKTVSVPVVLSRLSQSIDNVAPDEFGVVVNNNNYNNNNVINNIKSGDAPTDQFNDTQPQLEVVEMESPRQEQSHPATTVDEQWATYKANINNTTSPRPRETTPLPVRYKKSPSTSSPPPQHQHNNNNNVDTNSARAALFLRPVAQKTTASSRAKQKQNTATATTTSTHVDPTTAATSARARTPHSRTSTPLSRQRRTTATPPHSATPSRGTPVARTANKTKSINNNNNNNNNVAAQVRGRTTTTTTPRRPAPAVLPTSITATTTTTTTPKMHNAGKENNDLATPPMPSTTTHQKQHPQQQQQPQQQVPLTYSSLSSTSSMPFGLAVPSSTLHNIMKSNTANSNCTNNSNSGNIGGRPFPPSNSDDLTAMPLTPRSLAALHKREELLRRLAHRSASSSCASSLSSFPLI
eukprot:PhM_4_TR5783/c0_g2_i1/m.79660